MMNKLGVLLKRTIESCFKKGLLNETNLPEYVIEVPKNKDHGHFATNLPLTLASAQKRPPREIAEIIIDNFIDPENIIEKMDIAGPGFLNFRLSDNEWYNVLKQILASGEDYGRSDMHSKERVLVEFVSANPTGPLHLGQGRGAALGDSICRILEFRGYEVVREYYINDAGVQVGLLGESVYARWKQLEDPGYPFPENGYHGEYISDLAREISEEADLSSMDAEEAMALCSELGKKKMLEEIKKDLDLFRVKFDYWFSESDLFSKGLVAKSLEEMKEKDELYESDGALWIRTSSYGDDKDRVIKKKDGQYTYFASDISYHMNKYKRGFSKAVNIWGADHHGYIQRVKSALKANNIDEDWLSVLLIQLVKLWKNGQEVRMSKRTGQYVTMRDLMEEVDVDAARFVFLTKTHDSPLDFDVDLVQKQDSDNPVYYVQYAHARICSIFRKAVAEGLDVNGLSEKDMSLLKLEEEMDLIRFMESFPSFIEDVSISFEAHRLTYFLNDLASRFHRYFNLGNKISENRIVTENRDLSQARLALVGAVRIIIKTGLNLLGVSAPEKM
jgi:arginyl-tRNA synthetase